MKEIMECAHLVSSASKKMRDKSKEVENKKEKQKLKEWAVKLAVLSGDMVEDFLYENKRR